MQHTLLQGLLAGYKAAMQAYMDAMHDLAARLLSLIAMALNLPTDFFDMYFDTPMVSLRPLHYSAQVSVPDKVCCYKAVAMPGVASWLLAICVCRLSTHLVLPDTFAAALACWQPQAQCVLCGCVRLSLHPTLSSSLHCGHVTQF